MFTDWIVSQVGDDPDLIAKVVPDYPATGKRTLQDNGSWLRTLTRDNVELVRTAIDHIEPDAVVTVDGERYPADVIVYATGFHATGCSVPMDITGRDGVDLRDAVGRPSGGLPRHHRARLPELLLHVRARHQPGPRRQPDLPLRVPDALHHPVHRGPDRRRPPDDGAAPGRATTTGTSAPNARSRRSCGPSRRSSTRSSRTRTARSTGSAPGDSSTTGPGQGARPRRLRPR